MKLLRNILIAGAALSLPVLAAAPAGASTSHPKFIKALHAWAPATKQHTNESEVSTGETICHRLGQYASNEVPGVDGENDVNGGLPWGYTPVVATFSGFVNESGQVLIGSNGTYNPQGQVLLDDIFGVSVLDLCPGYEPAVKYINRTGAEGSVGTFPTTNKVPQWAIDAGSGTVGYAYSATPPAPQPPTEYGLPGGGETTTPPSTVPPTSGNAAYGGPPPGDGSPWQPAPQALVALVDKQYADNQYTSSLKVTGVYISQDPNSPQWYFVFVFIPSPPGSEDDASGAAIEEYTGGTWNMASQPINSGGVGCNYGPQGQVLPSAVPGNVLSDFAQSCS
jgi:hypothetical protein